MTLDSLSSPTYTGADLAVRVNATLVETRAARRFASAASLLADTTLAYGTGARPVAAGDRIMTAEGHAYDVATATATDHHLTTAAGVKLKVLPGPSGADMRAFGCKLDGAADDTARFTAALAAFAVIFCPAGTYKVSSVVIPANRRIVTGGRGTVFQQAAGSGQVQTLVVNGSGVQLGLEGFTVRGNIATDTAEFNHGVRVLANATTGNLSEIAIGDVWGEDIRGDVIFLGQGSNANMRTLHGVKVGWVRGSNILRNGVSIVSGRNIRVEGAEVSACGYASLLIEPNAGSGPSENIWVGTVRGRFAGIEGTTAADFSDNIHFGLVDLNPAYASQCVPSYAPGVAKKDGFTLRNVRRVRIDHMRAEGFDRCALFVIYNATELGAELVEVGTMRLRNCSLNDTTYNAFVATNSLSRWDIGMLDVEVSGTGKRVFESLTGSRVGVVKGSLGTGTSLFRNGSDILVGSVNVTGSGILLQGVTRATVQNGSFAGARLASSCAACSFLTMTATASDVIFTTGSEDHFVGSCTFTEGAGSAQRTGFGMAARSHLTPLRLGGIYLWMDAGSQLRASGSYPSSDSAGALLNTPANETAANLAALAAVVNTTGKFAGRRVWDSTNRREMRARGPLAADPWDVIDGSANVVPV